MKPTKEELLQLANLHDEARASLAKLTNNDPVTLRGHEVSAYALRLAANLPSEEEIESLIDAVCLAHAGLASAEAARAILARIEGEK